MTSTAKPAESIAAKMSGLAASLSVTFETLSAKPREHRQLDRPVDDERALSVRLHPIDGDALVLVGVETRDEYRRAADDQNHQADERQGAAANPDRHVRFFPSGPKLCPCSDKQGDWASLQSCR